MSTSGIHEVFNKTVHVERAFIESARKAVTKACFDTEAEAKREITRKGAIDTGAARASIYTVAPGKNDYEQSVSAAKAEALAGSRKHRKVHPGKSSRSIGVFPDAGSTLSRNPSKPEGIVAVGVLYGEYIEFGTHKMPARPFMLPAAEKVGPEFEKICHRVLEAELK